MTFKGGRGQFNIALFNELAGLTKHWLLKERSKSQQQRARCPDLQLLILVKHSTLIFKCLSSSMNQKSSYDAIQSHTRHHKCFNRLLLMTSKLTLLFKISGVSSQLCLCLQVLGRHVRDFVNGLDNLHEYLRFSYPKVQPPTFFCQEESATGVTLHYRSEARRRRRRAEGWGG